MYKHILIPTDGSALSEDAMRQGMAFAKSINAKTTVVTVSLPFHIVSVDPTMVSDTREQYERDSAAAAERYLTFGRDMARTAGVPCEGVRMVSDHP